MNVKLHASLGFGEKPHVHSFCDKSLSDPISVLLSSTRGDVSKTINFTYRTNRRNRCLHRTESSIRSAQLRTAHCAPAAGFPTILWKFVAAFTTALHWFRSRARPIHPYYLILPILLLRPHPIHFTITLASIFSSS